ncbi:MAG: M20/M25/M40 family metallo-hydrolase, partial [Parachlamydia sp.]|nr:M20/M25/M40 family metallo-hydrolase [Parachlamydia sp.]
KEGNMKHLFILFLLISSPLLQASNSPREKLESYLSHLVSLKTLSTDLDANRKALDWVRGQLKPLDLHFHSHEFEGHPSLVITTRNTKKPKLFLVAHIDVVPGGDSLFHPVVIDNKMYGRGTYDMKMAIACYLLLMQELKGRDLDIGILLTSDEEIGGMNGVRRILEAGYSSEVALLPDGGFDWKFEERAKGVLHLKIAAHGTSAHGSRPWTGTNAIYALIDVLRDIQEDFEKQKSGDYYPTANLGIIQGGKSVNQVPDYAEAKLDIRFPPSLSSEDICARVHKIARRHDRINVEKINGGSPHQVDLSNAAFQKFRDLAREMHGIEVGSMHAHGASDARFFGERHIPVLVIAPKGGEIHSDGEWVDLDDLARFYEVMKAWVISLG